MTFARCEVLGLDVHADFHRRVVRVVDRGAELDHVADVDWVKEIETIDACGDAQPAGMSDRCGGGRLVDKLHDVAAVDVAHRIRVGGLGERR